MNPTINLKPVSTNAFMDNIEVWVNSEYRGTVTYITVGTNPFPHKWYWYFEDKTSVNFDSRKDAIEDLIKSLQ